jgi:putative pyruvate formate lyase activating enzyme
MGRSRPFEPGTAEYLARIKKAYSLLSPCKVCPRKCGVDRLADQKGRCGGGLLPKIAAVAAHFGEEPPITGTRGSGTIFFTGCNLSCKFCQNFPISQLGSGREVTVGDLARQMLHQQNRHAHNINLVNPTHFVPQILAAIHIARSQGLSIPIVYNANGYEGAQALRLLAGVVNVYLPDWKYRMTGPAKKYSSAANYPKAARKAFHVYKRISGPLFLNEQGIAQSGMIVRHLILPGQKRNTRRVMREIKRFLGARTHISLMTQYFPAYKAADYREISRRVSDQEAEDAIIALDRMGLSRGWRQIDG